MLLSSGVGPETLRPLAAVVMGGPITSTLLTLVLLPVIYESVESRASNIRLTWTSLTSSM
jgi:cobalt-zinc-cadmium resistance protein CzcA